MKVKEFIGKCAERNREVIIIGCHRFVIAKGTVWDIFNREEQLFLETEIDCFYFSNDKLYITLK